MLSGRVQQTCMAVCLDALYIATHPTIQPCCWGGGIVSFIPATKTCAFFFVCTFDRTALLDGTEGGQYPICGPIIINRLSRYTSDTYE